MPGEYVEGEAPAMRAADAAQVAARRGRRYTFGMIAFALALELAACGTQLPTRLPSQTRQRRYTIAVDTLGVESALSGSADSAWKVLPAVYERLELPIHERDEASRRLGACWIRVRQRLSGAPLSRYLQCGELRAVPNADRMEIELLILSRVSRDAFGGAILSTFVLATAGESAGSSNRIWCLSTGALESRIRDAVQAALGPPEH
jgi:hypothetical protein